MNIPARFSADEVMVVLADLQPEMLAAGNRTNPEASLRAAVSVLVEAAGVLGIPVFRSVVPLKPDAAPQTIEELRGEAPMIRSTFGVFDHDDSRRAIAAHGRSIVAIGGISSEIAVLQAGLGALRAGHKTHVLVDACGGLGDRTEHAAFRQMEAAGGVLSGVASFLASVTPPLDDPRAQSVFASLSRLWS